MRRTRAAFAVAASLAVAACDRADEWDELWRVNVVSALLTARAMPRARHLAA